MPDARDPWDLQFYYMAMQWHEDWQIASVGYYRVEAGQQTQDLMLCFSRDGRAWQRPVRGGLIPRRPGEVDSMGVYAPNVWLDLGDRWLILYTGTPDAHNAPRESRQGVTPLGATLRKNRFVGLATGVTPGGFLTEPFIPAAPQITVDADIRGWLRAELCDAFGRKLPGHHLMDAVLLQGDSEAHVLRWRDQSADAHRYEAVRLRFEFAEGIIYGVGF